jgi:hypothetical protein
MIRAIGSELSSPNRPTNGEARAPKKNWSPPRSAEAAPGAARPTDCPMLMPAGRTRPTPPTVTKRVTQVPTSVSPTDTTSRTDRRAALVTITPAGAKAVDDLFPRQLAAEVELLAGLGEDREWVLKALGRLVEAMEARVGHG